MRRGARGSWLHVALVLALVIAAALGGYGITHEIRKQPAASPPPRPTPPAALASATNSPPPASTSSAPQPAGRAVQAALRRAVHDPAFGGRLLARVADARTGTVLYDRDGRAAAAPASTAKLLTAAAVLDVHAPTDRFRTTVVAGRNGSAVLVGGGDPTLSGAPAGTAPLYPGAARISDLAAQLKRAKTPITRIVVDDALFTGPAVSPDWAPEDVPSSYASAITALMSDGGRAAPGDVVRSASPDLAAGHELAAALGRPGLPVSRGTAPREAQVLASVRSAPVSLLIEQMLQESDNVIAEVLARQVALAEHRPASFAGSAAAIRQVLGRLGVRVGSGMRDGSGLAAADRLSPAALVAVLRLIAGARGPSADLRTIVTALPVAGWSGTLDNRYLGGSPPGAGRVRAKTGTLTGVSTLAGFVHDRSGRLLVFSLAAERAASNIAADAALDRVVGRLARCGCR